MTGNTEPNSAERRVILVMKQPGNARVLQQAVAEIGMTGVGVSSEEELREALADKCSDCTALVDVSGFGKAVWKMCELLHKHEVPFVVLSTPQDSAVSNRSLSYGAISVLQKPVAKAALLQLVNNLHSRQ